MQNSATVSAIVSCTELAPCFCPLKIVYFLIVFGAWRSPEKGFLAASETLIATDPGVLVGDPGADKKPLSPNQLLNQIGKVRDRTYFRRRRTPDELIAPRGIQEEVILGKQCDQLGAILGRKPQCLPSGV